MPEAKIVPFETDGTIIRYDRNTWLQASVDDWTLPPAQNPDAFLQLTNILPPATGVLLRRFGYRFFNPALDNGASIDSDEVTGGPHPVFAIPVFNYANSVSWGGGSNQLIQTFQPSYGVWAAGFTYTVGTSIVDSNGNVQQVLQGGVSGGTVPTWPLTVGADTTDGGVIWYNKKYAISVGDTIIVPMILAWSGIAFVTSITDSAGNVWAEITPVQDYNATNSWQTWGTRVSNNTAYGTPLTITFNFSQNLFGGDAMSIALWSNLGVQLGVLAQAQGTSATWSSGSVTVPANTILFSASVGPGETPTAPWTLQSQFLAFYMPGSAGTYADAWSSGSPVLWASSLFAYPFQAL